MSPPIPQNQKCQVVFEVSNEIANKIGGIYSVISSKAPELQKLMGPGNFIAIGLYNAFKARSDFEETEYPRELEEVFNAMRAEGIDVKYGRWIGGGGVETILVDPSYLLDVPMITGNSIRKIDQIKGILWDWFNIDSLWMPEVYDPMVAFGWAAGVLISHLVDSLRFKGKNIVAHFHEWISGPGLLYLRKNKPSVATVFMTHATQLGRTISMGEEDITRILDDLLQKGDTIPPQKAYQYHVEGTHQMEVVCAREADVLVTVSEAVARETEGILGHKTDFIIPNGINLESLSKKEELNAKHQNARLKIARFTEAYFLPYYSINFEKFLIIHISGRYEFHNKGIDVFIDALKIVNNKLKLIGKGKEILAFIWVPAPVAGIKNDILKAFQLAKEQKEIIQPSLMRIEEWLSYMSINYEDHLKSKNLFDFFQKEELIKIKELSNKLPAKDNKKLNPPICPFHLNERDTILRKLLESDLTNKLEDCVKVIFYPVYLSTNDQLLGLDYYNAVAGCDMGIYPSTYEPYGLTPLEALGLGVPAVTTDLTGFGLLITEQISEDIHGIYVLKRKGKTNTEASKELAEIIIKHSQLPLQKMLAAQKVAREISELYGWKNIIKEFKAAYDEAFQRNSQKH